ncbi:MAG: (d)CMP kinase [Planctomycetota bacterium]|nr:(d)CMP kinase [Planctomycetota bacterium]
MSKTQGIIVAIDGPAGSGKSTAARLLAQAEGYAHLNTGAMYRAVAFLALQGAINAEEAPDRVTEIARDMQFEYRIVDDKQRFLIAAKPGKPLNDHTEELFTAALTLTLKPVVNNGDVRAALVAKMQTAARKVLASGARGVVLEGRDIGTVVFPDAFIKFFVHADLDERTRRRADELRARGEPFDVEGLKKQIEYRDKVDESREVGPLRKADDAIDIDSSSLSQDQVLARLREELARRLAAQAG